MEKENTSVKNTSVNNTTSDVSMSVNFLSPLDNLGPLLVSSPLTGDNYTSWSRAMMRALSAKNKFGFIDGTLPQLLKTNSTHDHGDNATTWFHLG